LEIWCVYEIQEYNGGELIDNHRNMNFVFLRLSVDMIRSVIERFPLVVLFACLATGLAANALEGAIPSWAETVIIVCVVSFFVGLAGYIFAERLGKDKAIVSILLIIFAEGYFWFLPGGFESLRGIDFAQVFLLLFVSVICVFSAPYFVWHQINGFWQYNRQLVGRLFFTVISTGTLFVGITISLVSTQYLFEWQIQSEWYFRIWILIVGLVSTIVFLAGIPKQFDRLEEMGEYPYVLEIFSKYVLVPLLILYGSILYVYGGRILFTGEWPKGTVAFLVFWYALIGVGTCLLLFPRRDQSLWIRPMAKIFYVTLIPLAFLLSGAVFVRVLEYGWTANRGGMILFGVWMIGISIFNLTRVRDDIRYLFFTTAVSIFVFSFGPLSVFSAAQLSQSRQLESLLLKNSLLVDGVVVNQEEELSIPEEEKQRIRSLVSYLWDIRGLNTTGTRFGFSLEELTLDEVFVLFRSGDIISQEDSIMFTGDTRYEFQSERKDAVNISGFSRLYQFACNPLCISEDGVEEFVFENGVLQVRDMTGKILIALDFTEKSQQFFAQHSSEKQAIESSSPEHFRVQPRYIQKSVADKYMVFEKIQGKTKIKLLLDNIRFQKIEGKDAVESVTGRLFIVRP
jgi:hypothetical protein